jgi:hypothetical protein
MAYTYSKIATYTVGSGGISSINFINIPQTYTDLKLVWSIRSSADNLDMTIAYNGSGSNLSGRWLYGNGSTVVNESQSYGVYYMNQSTTTSNTFSNGELYMPNYTSSNNKSMSIDHATENNGTTARAGLQALLWSNSAALTSLSITPNAGNFVQYSTAHLYGIKAEL